MKVEGKLQKPNHLTEVMVLEHIIKRVKDGLMIKNPLHSISFYQNLIGSHLENFISLLHKNKKGSSLFTEIKAT